MLAITRPQLIKINRSLNDYIHLKEINKNLQMDLLVSDSLSFYWKKLATKTDTLYLLETKKYAQLTKINESLQATIKEERRKCRKVGLGVGVGGTLLGVLLGVLLGK